MSISSKQLTNEPITPRDDLACGATRQEKCESDDCSKCSFSYKR